MPTLSRLATGTAAAAAAAAGAAGVLALPVFGGTPRGARLARMQASPQWRGGRFRNALPTLTSPSPRTILDFWTAGRTVVRVPTGPVPTIARTRADFDAPRDLRLTWLGHSTTLVEIEGRRFLTDPVFGPTASPGRAFGVARFFEPPLPLAELPDVDAVVLSHDHYDHLDMGTVQRLAARVPLWVAPLGVGAHLERWGVPPDRIAELDWWDETTVGGVRLVCTPSRHFSGRQFVRDRTLWCGWAFVGDRHRVYSTGDGAFSPDFARVGERLGPFDAALVETGAYSPAWPDVHMGPEQAVQAHLAARGGLLVPVHWATFNLAFHGWTEPVERLLAAADAAGVRVAVPRPGESVSPADPPGVVRWWPEVAWKTAAEVPIVSSGI